MSRFTCAVRKLFALPRQPLAQEENENPIDLDQLLPAPGRRTLITGASGSGKSRLLKQIRRKYQDQVHWIDPASIVLKDDPVIDQVCSEIAAGNTEQKIVAALDLLARVGLAEAWTYLHKPSEISDGQRWRLLLAISFQRAKNATENHRIVIIATDEFAALLDRITAMIVASALRKMVDAIKEVGVIVVTSHDDLARALNPTVHVYCDFGITRIISRKLPIAQHTKRRKQEDQQQHACDNHQFFK